LEVRNPFQPTMVNLEHCPFRAFKLVKILLKK
jgi:hypothetical protein